MEPTFKTYIALLCSLLIVQLTHQAELATKVNTSAIYNSTDLDHAEPPVLQRIEPELRSSWRTEKDTNSSQTTVAAKSNVTDVESEDLPDVDIVGGSDESSVLPLHRQQRTFWPFTSLFGYDYDYPYMPPPPMFGRPGGFYRPGFGPGMMGHHPHFPPPPMFGLGFSLGL